MCGLAGFYSGREVDPTKGRRLLKHMGRAIRHRGPDKGGGIWMDSDAGIGLSSQRLAILDLSPAGNQPMESASGRFVLSYNGEAYNHLELRRELEAAGKAPEWRGSSDTETLLAGIEAWSEHLSGRSNRQAQLWTVLMFEAWLEARGADRTTQAHAGA